MAKKLFLTLSIIAFFASCSVRRHPTFDEGIVINGVRWATRNVDAPGTFTTRFDRAGRLFQWNRYKGWTATATIATGWDSSAPIGSIWNEINDPCPVGWRVPTPQELQSLYDAGSVWVTINGVNGRLFGTAPNQIFLPAAGSRLTRGMFGAAGESSFYWSSIRRNELMAYGLQTSERHVFMGSGNVAGGFSIRCVAK